MELSTRERLVASGDDPDSKPFGGEFTLLELHEAFKRVQPKKNWKLPVRRVIVVPADEQAMERLFRLTSAAVQFFAGGGCEFYFTSPRKVRVEAPGYYARIGA